MSAEAAARAPRRGPRQLAEWLTFAVCLAIVLSLAVHLAWRMRDPVAEIADARVTPRVDRVSQQRERFVLPVDVENTSRRTLRDVQLLIRYRGPEGDHEAITVLIDYLGQSAAQTVYAYLRADPRSVPVQAEALSYRIE